MNNINASPEKEIDLLKLGKILWDKRKFILKISSIGLVIGIIVAFSIPNTYITQVSLAPEQSNNTNGNVGTIAAMAGFNLGTSNGTALSSPEIFPDILTSTPFLRGLFDIKVIDEQQSIDTTLYVYINDMQKLPWWSTILGLPSKAIALFSSSNNTIGSSSENYENFDYISITKTDKKVLDKLKTLLAITVDKKTGIITLSVTMQSSEISASVAATVTSYLQKYVINYRTLKARENLEFTQKLYEETKLNYYQKQQELATYTDANIGVVSAKFATTRDRLQNEVNLAYTVYNQMAQELQNTKIKIQDTTPVYTILEPPVEPLVSSAPNRKIIIIELTFLFAFVTCAWILVRNIFSKNNHI